MTTLEGALLELRRVEALRANAERVALKALALAEEVYGWAVHEPNHHRLLGRVAELRYQLSPPTENQGHPHSQQERAGGPDNEGA